MKNKDLIAVLKKAPPDAEILVKSRQYRTLVRATCVGIEFVIPARSNKILEPGNEWRIPFSSVDKPEVEREIHFLIS